MCRSFTIKYDVAFVPVSHHQGGVVSVPVSHYLYQSVTVKKVGVAYEPFNPSEGGRCVSHTNGGVAYVSASTNGGRLFAKIQ